MEKFLTIALFMVLMSLLACSIGGLATMVLPFIVVFGTGLLSFHMIAMNMRYQMGMLNEEENEAELEEVIADWTQSAAGCAASAAHWAWKGGGKILSLALPRGSPIPSRRRKCQVEEEAELSDAPSDTDTLKRGPDAHHTPPSNQKKTEKAAQSAHSDGSEDESIDINIPVPTEVRKLKIHINLYFDNSKKNIAVNKRRSRTRNTR